MACRTKVKLIPADYQYYIGSWIYKVIGNASPEFVSFLHTEGYRDGNKRFKFFNYSPLEFGKPKIWKERGLFEIATDVVSMRVSFLLSEAAEHFIIGLFKNQEVYFGDHFNGMEFLVTRVERMPDPGIKETMYYKAISPVVLSYREQDAKYARYLAPVEEGYREMLKRHIGQKYRVIPMGKPVLEDPDFVFTLLDEPRSKLVTLKPGKPGQSKVRGYTFRCKITAPPEIHYMILNAGLGEKNATGFGWVEAINKWMGD